MARSRFRTMAPRGLLLLAVLVIPACFRENSAGPVVHRSDDFSTGDMSNWIVIAASMSVDTGAGSPAPSLLLNAGGGAAAEARSASAFPMERGLTVSMDIRVNPPTYGEFFLINTANPSVPIAGAAISASGATVYLGHRVANVTWPPDGQFHRFTFCVAVDGASSWSRDGVEIFSGALSQPLIHLYLADHLSGTQFDNLLVTSP